MNKNRDTWHMSHCSVSRWSIREGCVLCWQQFIPTNGRSLSWSALCCLYWQGSGGKYKKVSMYLTDVGRTCRTATKWWQNCIGWRGHSYLWSNRKLLGESRHYKGSVHCFICWHLQCNCLCWLSPLSISYNCFWAQHVVTTACQSAPTRR